MAQHIAFKFWIKIELEQLLAESWCHHIDLTSATTLTLWGVPNWVYYHASHWCLPRGKVMRGRYLVQVGWHKPCVPVVS